MDRFGQNGLLSYLENFALGVFFLLGVVLA